MTGIGQIFEERMYRVKAPYADAAAVSCYLLEHSSQEVSFCSLRAARAFDPGDESHSIISTTFMSIR